MVVLLGLAGCAAPDVEDRAAWLQNTLLRDHWDLLAREPALVAGKFEKMALSPFAYFRGTAPQYWRELTEVGRWRTQWAGPGGILLYGDPHPENIGTDQILGINFNDFDAARYGPSHGDVWRLAQGFGVMLAQTPEYPQEYTPEVYSALAQGYWDHIFEPSGRLVWGKISADLLRRARRDGEVREELEDYQEPETGRLLRGVLAEPEVEAVIAEETREPAEGLFWWREAVEKDWPRTWCCGGPSPVVKDWVRHLGSGVSSYPLWRYYVLLEGPTDAADDDVLIEAKEIRDPPPLLSLPLLPGRQHDVNAARVVDWQRRLQGGDTDHYLGWIARDSLSFRLRNRSKYQKGFDVARWEEKWAQGDWTQADLTRFAYEAGWLLAQGHGRAASIDGRETLSSLKGVLEAAGAEAWTGEVATLGQATTELWLEDYALFLRLIEAQGPLLGYRP